jgi:hypothetical protein
LLGAVIDITLERHRELLRRGTVLVDERDAGTEPRVLFFLEHAIQDGGTTRSGDRRVISKRLLFVEIGADGAARHVNYAPYLDYRPLATTEPGIDTILARPECAWIGPDLEQRAKAHAIEKAVPEHLGEIRGRKLALLARTEAAVKDRLTKEINYWDYRAEKLKDEERAGKAGGRLNSGEARKRADELQARLQRRMEEIARERQISPLPPFVLGGLLIVPAGLIHAMSGAQAPTASLPADTQASAARARAIVMDVERRLGFVPVDREVERLGYDIESAIPGTGRLRFIEVKGRVAGADTITVTRNEILTSLNKPEEFILAMVAFGEDGAHDVRYLRTPFQREPDFGVTSVNYDFADLLERAGTPS